MAQNNSDLFFIHDNVHSGLAGPASLSLDQELNACNHSLDHCYYEGKENSLPGNDFHHSTRVSLAKTSPVVTLTSNG